MRLTRLLMQYKHFGGKARLPQTPERVPFQEILPLKLKNRVSGKVDSQSQSACLQEISVLFAAMKDNDFNEQHCAREINALNKANKEALDCAKEQKMKNRGQIVTTGRQLTSKQLNKYLRGYPQPK